MMRGIPRNMNRQARKGSPKQQQTAITVSVIWFHSKRAARRHTKQIAVNAPNTIMRSVTMGFAPIATANRNTNASSARNDPNARMSVLLNFVIWFSCIHT